ncbi:DUF2202 domain-containing protein [Thermococcus piezophilus]|uniref:DUF2202 domain-containing protein n=1 Tax=Thermococcus piezophilus TaxID=1712654 RepID=A0A172WIY0_9EURY|nr:DUF2202 domain-containing protein [Thermococcus piezophilus]ANF23423.1 hypothetical protein A7C91_09805 [Thermococcus piezophilus]
MRNMKLFGVGLLALLVGMTFGMAAAMQSWTGPRMPVQETAPLVDSTLTTYYADLSQEEIDGLLWMREEEKLARDVYLTFYEMYGLPIFYNIAQSEQTHTDTVLVLIEKYNLTDPATDEIGVFTNPELQALYDQLVEMGSQGLVDALKVGALIEETDIADLEEWTEKTDNADIIQVYESLKAGSKNHLRGFVSVLANYGVTYEPQVISENYYQEVISSANSHGFGNPMGDIVRGPGIWDSAAQEPTQETGIIDSIINTFRNTWNWMRGFVHRIGFAI